MCPRRHWLDLPALSPAGAYPRRHWLASAFPMPVGEFVFFSPAYPAFSLIFCPLSPRPPSPAGKGENFSLFCRGLRPRHPCIKPFAALTISAMRAPRARAPAVRRRTGGSPFLRAVPAAKERGDRGRGTSAFEMVLSPGAGRASAAGVQPPCGFRNGKVSRQQGGQAAQRAPTPQVQPVPPPAQARGCKGRSPLHMKSKNLPLPAGKGGRGDGGKKASKRQGRQATKNASPPCGHHSGKVSRRPAGQAAPAGTCLAETVSAASGLMQGCRGRSPRRNKVIFSPFPGGEGGRGDGGRKQS